MTIPIFKIFEVSREKSGLFLIFLNFPRFVLPKKAGENLRKTWDRASRHDPNFGTGRVALPDPDLSKNQDGQSDLDLDLTQFFVEILSRSRYLAHSCREEPGDDG